MLSKISACFFILVLVLFVPVCYQKSSSPQPDNVLPNQSGEDPNQSGDKSTNDPILEWNEIALSANALDHSFEKKDQAGPTRTSRAFAIVHLAMYDAYNAVHKIGQPYLQLKEAPRANAFVAVNVAAYITLRRLYPTQAARFDQALTEQLNRYPESVLKQNGITLGKYVGLQMLESRANDGSQIVGEYIPSVESGMHRPDPVNPGQGMLDPAWGQVRPFAIPDNKPFGAAPFPALNSVAYAESFNEVKRLGGDGITTKTERTEEQTNIGIFWAYDGSSGLGAPPRLYNQITRVIAMNRRNSVAANARLFALVNVAEADAAIQCWADKYKYKIWRPIVGIREADKDDNPSTQKESAWTPLGAPASNTARRNFTPNFPAYTGGHAILGAAAMGVIADFYGTFNIPFTFVSDELNGITKGADGKVRPRLPRSFNSLTQAIQENADSRIYLGIHWSFDGTEGIRSGLGISDYVVDHILLPH